MGSRSRGSHGRAYNRNQIVNVYRTKKPLKETEYQQLVAVALAKGCRDVEMPPDRQPSATTARNRMTAELNK